MELRAAEKAEQQRLEEQEQQLSAEKVIFKSIRFRYLAK